MKKIILALLFCAPIFIQAQCPVGGNSTRADLQSLDSLKNRSDTTGMSNPIPFNVSDLLNIKDGDPTIPNAFISVTGYLTLAKFGGPETCNCKSSNQDDWDIHMELAANPGDPGTKAMICEVTRYTKPFINMTLAQIKQLVGQQITVIGLPFYDEEHENASEADSPQNAHDWRSTVLECHPIFAIVTP